MHGRFLFALPCLLLAACQPSQSLLITVVNIPDLTQSLIVLATHGGSASTADPTPFDIAQPAPAGGTLRLTLPDDFSGDIHVGVAAMDQPAGQGCLLAEGDATEDMFMGPQDALRVSLNSLATPHCGDQQPALFSAVPNVGNIQGMETVNLNGWGFRPGATVTMGSLAAPAVFVSATQLAVTTPANAGFGLTPIRVTNPNGSFDTRSDLFRFYTKPPGFIGALFDSGDSCYTALGDRPSFVVSQFSASSEGSIAVALPKYSKVRVFSLSGGLIQPSSFKDYDLGYIPGAMVAADFDQDGNLDLCIANDANAMFQILWNDGSGGLVAGAPFSAGTSGTDLHALAAGDVNGDGLTDLVVADREVGKVRILLNGGSRKLNLQPDIITQALTPTSLAMADVDQDGRLDLLVGLDIRYPFPNQTSRVAVYFNQGQDNKGIFRDDGDNHFTVYPVGLSPRNLAVADVDGDGKVDVIVPAFQDTFVSVLLSSTGYLRPVDLLLGERPGAVAAGDVNGDGWPDVVVACPDSGMLKIFLNNQGRGFDGVPAITQPAGCSHPQAVGIYDTRKPGTNDLVVVGDGCIANLRNCPPSEACNSGMSSGVASDMMCKVPVSFGASTDYPSGPASTFVLVADFNGDQRLDLVVANQDDNTVSMLLGNGAGGFGMATKFPVGMQPISSAVGDFNGDSKPDLAVANNGGDDVSVLLGNGAGGFDITSRLSIGDVPRWVTVGDFNGDTKLDLAVINGDNDSVSVLLGNGAGGFGKTTNFPIGTHPRQVVVGDLNGDHKADLVIVNGFSNNVGVLLGDGAGGFSAATYFSVGTNPYGVAVADFNGDGKLDLAVANGVTDVSVLLGDGTGGFGTATNFPVGENTGSVGVGDFDGDGKLDLALNDYANNAITILPGNGDGSFGMRINFLVGGQPGAVGVGDFNGDGKPDLVTANFLSNDVSVLLNQTR